MVGPIIRATKPNLSALPRAGRAIDLAHNRAANRAVDRAGRVGHARVRQAMKAAGLGKLDRAVGYSSSQKKNDRTNSPWAVIFAKGQNREDDRGAGALEAYSEGAIIRPKNSLFGTGWLWIPTSAIPKRIRGFKSTPALYNRSPLVTSIGKLVFKRKSSNRAVLIVNKVRLGPKTGRAKAQGKRRSKYDQDSVVAFVGIKITRRMRRFNQRQIMRLAASLVPRFTKEELERDRSIRT